MKRVGCPIINVANKAVEETAGLIIDILKKERAQNRDDKICLFI